MSKCKVVWQQTDFFFLTLAVKASLLSVLAAAICYFWFFFFCIATDIVKAAKA